MHFKLKISAILFTLLFAIIPITQITANATTFDLRIPSFGLYCENENAILKGNVNYVIDESGKAVQYSEYSVNNGTFYIPFISSSFNIPDIDIDLKHEICYGETIGFSNEYKYDFYSSDLNGMIGTIYTLNTASESFTVNFAMLENQNCIYRFTNNYSIKKESTRFNCTVNDAQTDIPYEVFILNGDCKEFESSAEITKETVTVKEYIDRQFNVYKDFYSVGGEFTPAADVFYALANQAAANNIDYEFFDFFIDSFARMRLNAYKIEVKTPCTISYSMAVDVQKNESFTPAIYKVDQTAAGNYAVDYTVELNSEIPYIIESSSDFKKLNDYYYTANSVTDDFYFIFSSTTKPESIYGNDKNDSSEIVLYVVLAFACCALIVFSVLIILHCKKTFLTSK